MIRMADTSAGCDLALPAPAAQRLEFLTPPGFPPPGPGRIMAFEKQLEGALSRLQQPDASLRRSASIALPSSPSLQVGATGSACAAAQDSTPLYSGICLRVVEEQPVLP